MSRVMVVQIKNYSNILKFNCHFGVTPISRSVVVFASLKGMPARRCLCSTMRTRHSHSITLHKGYTLDSQALSAAYMDYCLCLTCFLSLVLSPFERVLDSWTLLSFMMELLKNSVAMQEQVLACKGFLVIGYTLERVRRTQTNTAGWHVHNRSLLSDQQVH